jgi:hypothetical protein
MNSPLDIDRVVREVLVELLAQHNSTPHAPCAEKPHTECAKYDYAVDSRVVTLAEIAGRLEGVRRLVVPPRAVVTPAARDELRRRGIEIVRDSAENDRAKRGPRLTIVKTGTPFDATALVAGLAAGGMKIQQQTDDCIIAATDHLAGELAGTETLCVLLTSHTAAALCLANRHTGVRAVLATVPEATAAAADAVGANLLIVDPAIRSFYQLKQILGEFCRGGVRPCPEVFKKRLG